jgi:hypothetical protein
MYVDNGPTSAIDSFLLSGFLTLDCDLIRVRAVLASDTSIFTPNTRVFETAPEVKSGLTIGYGTATTDFQETSLDGIRLSIGNVDIWQAGRWRFCVSGQACSAHVYGDIRSLLILVPGAGSYSILADGPFTGYLSPTRSIDPFSVAPNGSFFSVGYFMAPSPKPTPSPKGTPTASAESTPSMSRSPSPKLETAAEPETDAPAGSGDGSHDGSGDGSGTLSAGAVAGIVIAVLAVVAVVAVFVVWRLCGLGSKAGDGGASGGGASGGKGPEDLSDDLIEDGK